MNAAMTEPCISIPVPNPGAVLLVASDGEVYATLPVSRDLLADRFPEVLEMLDEGLARTRARLDQARFRAQWGRS